MMVWIIDVDNVDHPIARLKKWNVIVGYGTLSLPDEDAAVSELESLPPYPVDHFWSSLD